VTWLADGLIEHRDSLGNHQMITPGQLNVMTSGHGIAHSETTPADHPPGMHGLQLWVALPHGTRHGPPSFEHHPTPPVQRVGDTTVTVLVGDLGDVRSPARGHTPLLAAEVLAVGPAQLRLPAEPTFEYGLLAMSGQAVVAGAAIAPGSLLYLGTGHDAVTVEARGPARLMLLGGVPFDEPLVMWWNFVAGTHEEIVAAREDWATGRRFGPVPGATADPLPAPQLPTVRLKARDRFGTLR
jgi:redox-sensitive bicupin YhaK (pirin superfamily)